MDKKSNKMNRNNRKPKTIRKQKLWKIKKTSPRKFPSTLNDIKENFAQCSLNTHTLITHNKVRPPCESNDKNQKKERKSLCFLWSQSSQVLRESKSLYFSIVANVNVLIFRIPSTRRPINLRSINCETER